MNMFNIVILVIDFLHPCTTQYHWSSAYTICMIQKIYKTSQQIIQKLIQHCKRLKKYTTQFLSTYELAYGSFTDPLVTYPF